MNKVDLYIKLEKKEILHQEKLEILEKRKENLDREIKVLSQKVENIIFEKQKLSREEGFLQKVEELKATEAQI